ncbi:MAG: sugar porter family MFS transporter [Bacteroidota bacterium]|nr:sugar porter family MFS transporter [Bacteroidota bacterium]
MIQKQTIPNKKYFFLVCFIAAMGGFLFGFDTAVISGVLEFVSKDFHFSLFMEGWFVSCALLGCIIGVAAAGKLSDRFGRKKIMLLSASLFFISAMGCMLADNSFILILFRLVGGLGIGVASMICPLYIAEFSPSHFRGRMVALYQLAITLGIVAAYFTNAYLVNISLHNNFSGWLHYLINLEVWRSMIGLGMIPAFIFLFSLFLIPESPRWLLINGRENEALKYLNKINTSEAAHKEVKEIKESIEGESGIKELFSPVYKVALIIGLALPFLSQVSGINAIIYFGPSILDKAGFSLGDALGGQVTIGIINVLFTFVAIFTVDKWGRKPLLIMGISGAVFALIVLGFLFKLNIVHGPWILIFILLFIACFAFSFGPVSWIIISEIFPTSVRGRAVSLATLSLWIANFFVGQLTPLMLKSDNWGPAATFWTFAVLCAPALWLTLKLIPETKGKSLEDIEKYWKGKTSKKLYAVKTKTVGEVP